VSENAKNKTLYRLPPCRGWDIERMESWLEDMAAQGLHLRQDGFFCGVASFERGAKKRVRYRLEPALKGTSPYGDNGGDPDDEALEINEQMGWQYAAKTEGFHIYRCEDADAPELNTDPQVQALVFKKVRGRMIDSAVGSFLYLIVSPILWVRGGFLLTMIAIGTPLALMGAALLLWGLVNSVTRAVYFARLRRRLLQEGDIDHRKPWRAGARRRRVTRLALPILAIVWFVIFAGLWLDNESGKGLAPLETYPGEPPFVTMADLAPDGEYEAQDWGYSQSSNMYRSRRDLIAPKYIEWEELADIALPDGTRLEGGLDIEYFEAATPWLARMLAKELLRVDRYGRSLWDIEDFEYIPLPPIEADYIVGYRTLSHFPRLVIQKGNAVISIEFYQTSNSYTMPTEQWAELMAAGLE